MKFKQRMFGYDFNLSDEVSSFKVIGAESQSSLLDTGAVMGTRYLLNGLNADLGKKLKSGEAYLEFWIECIDHTKPTLNRKLYPYDVFKAAMESMSVRNQLNNGGIPGRYLPDYTVMCGRNRV